MPASEYKSVLITTEISINSFLNPTRVLQWVGYSCCVWVCTMFCTMLSSATSCLMKALDSPPLCSRTLVVASSSVPSCKSESWPCSWKSQDGSVNQSSPLFPVLLWQLVAEQQVFSLASPFFGIVQTWFVLVAPVVLSFHCALEEGLIPRVVAGYRTIPGKLVVLEDVDECFMFAWMGGDGLPDVSIDLLAITIPSW